MKYGQRQSGFTLIELLVVVSIVGLLASVVLSNLNDARNKAYDTVRKQDLRNIQVGLDLYYDDHGRYPPERWCDSSIGSAGVSCWDMIVAGNDQDGWDYSSPFAQAFIDNDYMTSLPVDPENTPDHFYYYEPNNVNQPYPGAQQHKGYYVRVRLSDGALWGVCGGNLTGYASWCNE